MKLAVVFTGGTIGSKTENGVISTNTDASYTLLSYLDSETQVSTFSPFITLSEYFTGEHINILANCIEEILNSDFDGIIIAHGTDTLQFSAAALGYFFANSNLPIVFVSSQYVLDNPLSNGKQNFLDAVEFIKNQNGRGVFVVYRNNDGRRLVHRGIRLLASQPYSDDVNSVCNKPYGEFTNQGFMLFDSNNYPTSFLKARLERYCEKILTIEARVGVNQQHIPEETKAILHSTYHCGTLNTLNKAVFENAKNKKIPVFITGASNMGYESESNFSSLGITPLPQMSPLASYIKLWIILDGNLPLKLLFENFGDIL